MKEKDLAGWQARLVAWLGLAPDQPVWVSYGADKDAGMLALLKHVNAEGSYGEVPVFDESAKLSDVKRYMVARKNGKQAPPKVVVFKAKAKGADKAGKACYEGIKYLRDGIGEDKGLSFFWGAPHIWVVCRDGSAADYEACVAALGSTVQEML